MTNCAACSRGAHREKVALATTDQRMGVDWDSERNGPLAPGLLDGSAMRSFWWKCERGHQVLETARIRQKRGGCLFCVKANVTG